jgi:chemotaxis protein methyltransferase CheR
MHDTAFNELADLALKGSGQTLVPSKAYLISARLAPIARREGFGAMEDLVHCIKARANPVLVAEVTAAMLSKDTGFFRERDQLSHAVNDVLAARLAAVPGKPRVWCAGGSTGQEAYSLALLMAEAGLTEQIELVSTDLCKVATDKARAGVYNHYDAQMGLSIHRLLAHFNKLQSGEWQVSEALRTPIGFRVHNLLETASGLGKFDVIFCRHVLSGMSRTARARVAEHLAGALQVGGMIYLGRGETFHGLTDRFEPARDLDGVWVAAGTANTAAARAAGG